MTGALLAMIMLVAAGPIGHGTDAAEGPGGPRIERWGMFELSLHGPKEGNPFLDVQFSARFEHEGRAVEPDGFYDGDGVYRVRFMPDALGRWRYQTKSNRRQLDAKHGEFLCVEPSPGNHGPVRVRNTYRFAYADGAPYFQVGTTCYAWAHQGDELEEQTLATLKNGPFNKLRMCVFPKDYVYSKNEPEYYPFEGARPTDWDFTRFNPEFFRHFEKRVGELRELGIEADLILFHPYDRWGFSGMSPQADDRYVRYVAARLAAYRNVWWSLANEYDFLRAKKEPDWDRLFQVVRDSDPYGHLRSVHNGRRWYDHTKPWVTHCSVQTHKLRAVRQWREEYRKPVIVDECGYEGDVEHGWGNLSARELVNRFWLGTVGGGYVGHGETYRHPEDILWWSKGGVLHGQSPPRIGFLKQVMERAPYDQMSPGQLSRDACMLVKPGQCYLIYFAGHATVTLELPGTRPYKVDGIHTWNMTTTALENAGPGEFTFTAPDAGYLLRLCAYAPDERLRGARREDDGTVSNR